MKKIILSKSLSFLITIICGINFGFGQTKIAELTFETAGGYTTSVPEFTDGSKDYFIRTNGSNISTDVNFINIQGSYYFAAQDLDGETPSALQSILINDIDITGYTNIEFRVHLAEDDYSIFESWDYYTLSSNKDRVDFNYDIDNTGTFNNLLWIRANGLGINDTPAIDTDFNGRGDGTEITDTFTQFTQNIIGTGSLLDIEIEFYFDSGEEDIAIDNIEIWGVLVPCPGTTTIWNGSSWSNGTPDLTTEAILNASYNTTTNGGSFSACSLTVANTVTLNISNNDYVEVENDLTVDAGGIITVQSSGAFVQNNDSGVVTNNGTITVIKTTAPLNNWYEYTYWSTPVSGETINGGLTDSEASRRYIFNAQNFLDATAETANNNATAAGQDDIDDNGDDWQWVDGTTVMQPGIGYAATHSQAVFLLAGIGYDYTFSGSFNNGVVNVPVYRNDGSALDNNWNFIGNPYPSAIDVTSFFTQNIYDATTNTAGTLEGAIYYWSQNTIPTSSNNGNQILNFANSDYALHNGVGGTAGGDGLEPSGYIPSGQGFFISFSQLKPTNTGNVIFNNAMRVKGASNNSQFFKNTNSKKKMDSNSNKLWVNLTSDNGVFNQILIGYLNSATNNDDGAYYDACKIVAHNVCASLYSTIENSDKKYAIQGKALNSLDENEIIKLGFKTTINVATLYKLTVAQLEGEFLNSNTIYLKDNLNGTAHNLSASDYTFTSEVGEFNERFEIAFTTDALSTNNKHLNTKSLKIVQLGNDNVQFSTSDNLSIKSIHIFDLLGRQLYNLKGNSSSETYKLTNLNSVIYIAKIELSNGAVVTKKTVLK